MIFRNYDVLPRLKWAFESCKNGAWGDEPNGENDAICIRAADFNGDLGSLTDRGRTLRSIDAPTYGKVGLRAGDLVVEKSGGGEKQLVGRSVIYNGSERAVCSNFLARCRPNKSVNSEFLNYLMLAIYKARGTYPHIKQTTGIQNLDMASFLNIRVSLPSPETQKRIATFLNEKTAQIDALIEKKRELLDRLAEKRQAIITLAVTKGLNPSAPMKDSGIDWLGRIPSHWQVKPLKRMKKYLTSGSRDWAEYYADEGENFLRMTNVTKGGIEIDSSDLRRVKLEGVFEGTRTATKPGDILITITAELGSVAIVREEYEGSYINQHLALFRCDQTQCDPNFIVNFLWSDATKAQFVLSGQGGTKQGLGFDQVDGVIVAVPPLQEQHAIAKLIQTHRRQLDVVEGAVAKSLASLTEYRSALITATVTGQIKELQ
jgi:type I restriction enzyme S subunit